VDSIIEGDGEITFLVDENIYRRSALLRACYWLTDRCYVFISREGENFFGVNLRLKKHSGAELQTIAGEFANSLLDFELRAQIDEETTTVRELIVAKAFAEGNLLDDQPVGDDQDPVELRNTASTPRTD